MINSAHKQLKRTRRHNRIRARVHGTKERPRLAVYRSNTALSAQVINDDDGMTLVSVRTARDSKTSLTERAKQAGLDLAKAAKAKKVTKVVFDRGGFIYTGNVKALAEAAREGGLEF